MSAAILLGQILAMQGELAAAERLFEDSLEASRERGDVAEIALSLRELANIALESNRPDDAVGPLEEASALIRTSEKTRWMNGLLAADLARVAFAQGRVEDARADYEESMARAQQFGIATAIAGCGLGLARVERIVGSPQEAQALLDESVRILRNLGDAGGLAHAFVEAALLHSQAGDHERAVQLLAAADAARERIGIVTPGSEQRSISDARAAANVALGAAMVVRNEALGRTLTDDDVVALV
jgi:tetratricopeptide (TPR) repeat protein